MSDFEVAGDTAKLGISPAEFEQYQKQFIEERAEKYALLDKIRKLEQQNAKLSTEKSDKEFDVKVIKDKFQKPLQSLLSRAKRDSDASEASNVQHDHELLQKRLHSQEEDFQRQNALLMQELQALMIKNEDLERKQRQQTSELSSDSRILELENRIESLLCELESYKKSAAGGNVVIEKDNALHDAEISQMIEQLNFKATVANEERIRLQKQLDDEKVNSQEKLHASEKLSEKLRRDLDEKQTTVQLLLTEREQIHKTFNDRLSNVLTEKENMRAVCKSELDKIREENFGLKQAMEEEKVMAKARVEDIERQMKDLLEQMDVTSNQTKRDNEELLSEHKKQIAALLQEVEQLSAENTELHNTAKNREETVKGILDERTKLVNSEGELAKLCEKRKATIEDLTVHLDTLKKQHEEELERKQNEISRVTEPLKLKLELASAEAVKVPTLQTEIEDLRTSLRIFHQQKDVWVKESSEMKERYEEKLVEAVKELESTRIQLKSLRETSSDEIAELSSKLVSTEGERTKLAEELSTLSSSYEQQIHDKTEELKIIERKNAGVVRDLQKQLQSEKKRLEKVQHRLNEVLRDGGVKLKTLPDDSADFTEKEETGSVSSWSFVSSKSASKKQAQAGDSKSDNSRTDTETGLAATMTDQEIRDMVNRITKLQQEKAVLNEKIVMLESGNAAMAQDLLNKTALINQHYQQTPITGPSHSTKESDIFSLRNVLERLGRDKSIDVDTQKNLRHLLEETLTKNIHLQKNMELLTEELDRLRGSSPPR